MTHETSERWRDRTDEPLIVAAVLFLAAYAWPVLDPDLPAWARGLCEVVSWVVWALFAADFVVRLCLAPDRRRFLRHNWVDVITLAVPMLRPLRALRAIVALNVLGRRGSVFARGRVVVSVVCSVALVGFVAAVAVLDAERANPEANLRSFGDAAWWAATTVTTVGYGDRYPTTTEGRWVAVGLMLTGIALVGVVTAALASWFVERLAEVQAAEERTEEEVSGLVAEVRALREELAALRAGDVVLTADRRD